MSNRKEDIAFLSGRGIEPPNYVQELSDEQVHELRIYLEEVLEVQLANIDKMFEMAGKLARYIPGFIRNKMVTTYMTPAIVARVAEHMTAKEAVGVSGGLPDSFIGDSLLHMSTPKAGALLVEFKQPQARRLLDHATRQNPDGALAIVKDMSDNVLRKIASHQTARQLSHTAEGQPDLQARLDRL